MVKDVVIIGAGGHARSLINLLEINSYAVRGIYDGNSKGGEEINGYKVTSGKLDTGAGIKVVLAIGDNLKREKFYKKYYQKLLKRNVIHPKAVIEKRVMLGACNQVFADVYINSNATIGDDNILNTRSTIEHEVVIGNHNHVAIGALLCGRVKIGNNCLIGAGAVIIDKVRVCDNVIVGANSVVIDDITKPGTYVGNPVRKIR